MKIGILSMQRVYNYGSMLQAYSLKTMVEDICGHEVEFLDPTYDEQIITNMPVLDSDDYKSTPFKPKGEINYIYKKVRNKLKNKSFNKSIEEFQRDKLKLSTTNNSTTYDLVIEGSDEVFKATNSIPLNLYGKVNNAKHLVTYAACCGSSSIEGIPKEKLAYVKQLMSKFESMSVRDTHTIDYVGKLYDGKIEMHMDPVLMGNLYKKEHKRRVNYKYMIVYAYSNRIHKQEEIEAIRNIAKKRGLKTIAVGAPQYWTDEFLTEDPLIVLDYFYYADCVVTDTFHGAIFSIINHCDLVVILRKTNQNKLGGLLKQLKLQDRILTTMSDMEKIIETKPDYGAVDNILEQERAKTKQYLTKVIRRVEEK